MSVRCSDCGAVSGYGQDIHRCDCPRMTGRTEKVVTITPDIGRLLKVEGFMGAALHNDAKIVIGFDTKEHAKAWWDDFHKAMAAGKANPSSLN